MKLSKNTKLCIIGLGYVGLPLMEAFSRKFSVVGYDTNLDRIKNLKKGYDETLEVRSSKLQKLKENVSSDQAILKSQDFFIVTVPTPINKSKKPDIRALKKACKVIGSYIEKGNYVIFESTVYPGLTEEICIPILEQTSGLSLNDDFYVGYSPERINPGDKKRTLTKIVKVVSASNDHALKVVNQLYSQVITAGTFKANSIRIAEAAKIIENTQRDINIALMNELSHLFSTMDIDFNEVLAASNTKWNFLDFKPGLVGGHCIGVDPYYLTYKAKEVGFDPKMILAGRETNEMVPRVVCSNLLKNLKSRNIKISQTKGLILGATFKENCPDFRNSKVDDLVNHLKRSFNLLDIYDPYFSIKNHSSHIHKSNFKTLDYVQKSKYDFILIAVAHNQFKKLVKSKIHTMNRAESFIYDLKGMLSPNDRDLSL